MITICHPVDDLGLLFLHAALDAAGITHFAMGEHFGNFYPGMQIPAYNERSVEVPAGLVDQAAAMVAASGARTPQAVPEFASNPRSTLPKYKEKP